MIELTRAQALALTSRPDLLAEEATLVTDRRLTWGGRLRALGDYGRAGGSAGDRRALVEALAQIEADQRPRPITPNPGKSQT